MSDKPASPARGRKKTAPPAQQPPQEEVVVRLPLADLYPFPDHPFQVRDDEEMRETIQSVKEYGVIVLPSCGPARKAATLTDKENAGAALLDACKEVKNAEPVQVGSYRGFAMSVSFDAFRQEYTLQLKGQMTHQATLGADPRGNLTRIDNALAQMPQRLESVKTQR